MMPRRTTLQLLPPLAALVISAGLALAVRTDDPPPPKPPAEQDAPMFDRDAFTARMQRRIDEMEREIARLKDAKQRVEKGEAPPRIERPWSDAKKSDSAPRERFREMMERRRGDDRPPAPGSSKNDKNASTQDRTDYESVRPRLLESAPGIAELMDRLREHNREVADRVWLRMTPHIKEAAALKERDPEGFRLKADEVRSSLAVILSIGMVREAKENHDDSALSARRTELREAISKQVDAKIAVQRHEIEALDQRLERLRKSVDTQVQDREKTIDDRATKLEESPDGLMGETDKQPKKNAPQKK